MFVCFDKRYDELDGVLRKDSTNTPDFPNEVLFWTSSVGRFASLFIDTMVVMKFNGGTENLYLGLTVN